MRLCTLVQACSSHFPVRTNLSNVSRLIVYNGKCGLGLVSLSVAAAANWKHCFKHKRWRGPSARNCVKLIEDVCDLKAEDQEL